MDRMHTPEKQGLADRSEGVDKPSAKVGRTYVASMMSGSLRAATPFVLLALVWQAASFVSAPYLFPGLGAIFGSVLKILTTWDLLSQGLITWARLMAAVLIALALGVPIGLAMGLSRQTDQFVRPLVKFIMGVPALNWVIIVIIWFANVELRIAFVLVVLCLPITIFCVYDGVRSIDQKLTDMVLSFGADRSQHVRLLMWPFVKAAVFTAAKLNVGNAVRTVIVAELVGAPLGIGRELDLAKNLFDMPMVLAWTLLMVGMAFAMTHAIEAVEAKVLRWRGDPHAQA